jgi:hypothetical protein
MDARTAAYGAQQRMVTGGSLGQVVEPMRIQGSGTVVSPQSVIQSITVPSGIKSVQSGIEVAAGTTTITAVDVNKSFILSNSKGSAGTVKTNSVLRNGVAGTAFGGSNNPDSAWGYPRMEGGTTDLTVKVYSAVLTDATTVTFDGPCEWQVIEFY